MSLNPIVILFLAYTAIAVVGLLLMVFNPAAETRRQRLRKRARFTPAVLSELPELPELSNENFETKEITSSSKHRQPQRKSKTPGSKPGIPVSIAKLRDNQPVVIFEARKLAKKYGEGPQVVDVLQNANFKIFNQTTAIMGPNGCGKSTTMNLLGGLDSADDGELLFQGETIKFKSRRHVNRHRLRLAYIHQDLNLFDDYTIVDNVAFSLTRIGIRLSKARKLALKKLAELEIDRNTAWRFPSQLSGGQRQRSAIARALLAVEHGKAKAILADEPTASVDAEDSPILFQQLIAKSRDLKIPLVVITHDRKLAQMADRILVVKDKNLVPVSFAKPHQSRSRVHSIRSNRTEGLPSQRLSQQNQRRLFHKVSIGNSGPSREFEMARTPEPGEVYFSEETRKC